MRDIDLSPLAAGLENLAFRLFRAWTAEVEKRHPPQKITILDEGLLVLDLKESLSDALRGLAEKQDPGLGFAAGFFLGYVESSLNKHWCHEYLDKQSNEYKMLLALQATNRYLMEHRGIAQEIQESFQEALQKDCNFPADGRIASTLGATEMQMEMPRLARILNVLDSNVFVCFDNAIAEKVLAVANAPCESYLLDLESFLPIETVKLLIEANRLEADDV